ncbi:uncharacterized protein [Eurosta solidaginis]|uniref:uncharacterized protein isoform X2 n=1 Tax=Eurosta solidaginis TaxID=178769 RepID=UPI003530CA30
MTTEMSINLMQRHLLTIEKLRTSVLESNVTQLIDDVKDFNDELIEVQRLDALISALRDYNGPTICHEWPYPLIFKGTIEKADVAQILNGRQRRDSSTNTNKNTSKYNKSNKNNVVNNGLRHTTVTTKSTSSKEATGI